MAYPFQRAWWTRNRALLAGLLMVSTFMSGFDGPYYFAGQMVGVFVMTVVLVELWHAGRLGVAKVSGSVRKGMD